MNNIKSGRRVGNTTRQIDQCVQELFTSGSTVVIDHAHRVGNKANEHQRRIFMERLAREHRLIFREHYTIKGDIVILKTNIFNELSK